MVNRPAIFVLFTLILAAIGFGGVHTGFAWIPQMLIMVFLLSNVLSFARELQLSI